MLKLGVVEVMMKRWSSHLRGLGQRSAEMRGRSLRQGRARMQSPAHLKFTQQVLQLWLLASSVAVGSSRQEDREGSPSLIIINEFKTRRQGRYPHMATV